MICALTALLSVKEVKSDFSGCFIQVVSKGSRDFIHVATFD